MELHIRVSQNGFESLSSAERIEAIDERLAYFKERIGIRKEKLKAAQKKGAPALKELAKAKKSGRVPAAVKAAAKKAQAAIDLQQGKIDLLTNKSEKFAAKKAALKEKMKASGKKAAKAPAKKTKAAKAPKVEKKTARTKVEKTKPTKAKTGGRVRPSIDTDDDFPDNKSRRPKPVKLKKGAKVEKPVAPVRVEKRQVERVVEPPTKLSVPIDNSKEDNSIHPQDRALAKLVGAPATFAAAKNRSSQLLYLRRVYDNANKALFGGRLVPPYILLLKKVSADKFRLRGKYSYGRRELHISPNLFGAGKEALVVTTVVHEMCHQAVYELDHLRGAALKAEGGHGREWRNWMVKVGLTPARFSKYDNMEFMDEKTKAAVVEKTEKLKATKSQLDQLSPYQLRSMMPVSWVDSRKPGITIPGILLTQNGKGPKTRWAVLTYDPRRMYGMVVMNVPPSIIYKATEKDAKTVSDPSWQSEAQRKLGHVQAENEKRRAMRGRNRRDLNYLLNSFMPK